MTHVPVVDGVVSSESLPVLDGMGPDGRRYHRGTMGQPIVVIEKPSSNPGVVRFETNRAITGMGHELYRAGTEVWGERPADELARRILARGGVAGVQINGNMVTVDLEKGFDTDGLKEIVENLYRFYPDQPEAAVPEPEAETAEPEAEA